MDKHDRRNVLVLGVILLVAAVLRLGWPDRSPPGLQIDEADNAWNAYCLLKTGYDEHGVSWPIFYTAGFDDARSPLYVYLLLPFQAIWGMTPYTTRLPAALGGVATVGLLYWIGKRWFGPAVGLMAAGLLAINPWHLQHTRWGHEGCIGPFLVLGGLAAVLAANAPFTEENAEERMHTRPWLCLLAGALMGLSCYGYSAIRPYVPALLLGSILVTLPLWRKRLRQHGGAAGVCCLAIGFIVPFGALVIKHLTDPLMNARANQTWVWNNSHTIAGRLGDVLMHYLGHYTPDFFFVRGATDISQMPPVGFGMFHWYELPLMLCGIVAIIPALRKSYAARILLVALLVYPAGDTLNGNVGQPQALRSMLGMWSFELLAAVGGVWAWQWLRARRRFAATLCAAALAIWVCVSTTIYLSSFLGSFNRNIGVYRVRNVGLQQVCEWLKPRLGDVDQIYWSQTEHPYIYAPILTYLQYDPKDWFSQPLIRVPSNDGGRPAKLLARCGKMHFMYVWNLAEADIAQLVKSPGHGRAVFVVHPWETAQLFRLLPVSAVYTALQPDGDPDFFVLETAAR